MALQCGIIGITNIGKTTLFNCISRTKAEASNYAFSATSSNIGMIEVPDPKVDKLAELVNPAKVVPASVEIVDIPGLTKGSNKGEGVGNQFLADIRSCDALVHVLRCFEDDNLPHIDGSIDPVRDKETVDFELQVKDIESVEKKIQRLEKIAKSGDKEAKSGLAVLQKMKAHIELFKPARTLELTDAEKLHLDDLFLLSMKPVMYVCNVEESSAASGNDYVEQVRAAVGDESVILLVIAAAAEAEIAELEDENDRKEFLSDLGLTEPGVNLLVRSAYDLLNLMSFYTAGPKEVRAWTIRKGMKAPQAAGAIHSDLERGFIRAEVIKFDDYVTYGTEQAVKEAGKLSVEGKNYIIQEGDVLHIRFNV
jgi:ribosome-binding ATPase